jgi:ribonucleoside-triphosphate reductase (formate)
MTQAVTGSSLKDSLASRDFAKRVVAHLNAEAERLSAKHKVRFLIAESQDLIAPHRLALLDLRKFGELLAPQSIAKLDEEEIFYTNSVKLPVTTEINATEKIEIEGALQSGMVWNATTDFWLGVGLPSSDHLASIIAHAFHQTKVSALTFSPEFTVCNVCQKLSRGLHSNCPHCNSTRVDGLAQATSRYNRTSTWPRWKLAELRLRRREEV